MALPESEHEPLDPDAPARRPESGLVPAAPYALRTPAGPVALPVGETIIGRSGSVDVQLDSPLVSRQHCKLVVDDEGVTLVDLGSRNGMLVNDRFAGASTRLQVGDRITVGESTLTLVDARQAPPRSVTRADLRHAQTQSFVAVRSPPPAAGPADDAEVSVTTSASASVEMLAVVFDRLLALGQLEKAERMVTRALAGLLEDASARQQVADTAVATAARVALRLARASRRAGWIDYVIRLHAALGRPLPLATVEELLELVRQVRGADPLLLRKYVETLQSRAARLGPAERFAVQRLEALARVVSG
ncbi:MAG: FHA domain-containing protein [Polyangiaceae bacterium]|nr:FHA domain-containing protein [Polyangiaceae bacterium]